MPYPAPQIASVVPCGSRKTTWVIDVPFGTSNARGPTTVCPGASWPEVIDFTEAVKVTYVAGVSVDAAGVPDLFKNAIKKVLTDWYEKRGENVKRLPTDVEWMLNIHRVIFW